MNESSPNALELARAGLATGENRRFSWIDSNELAIRIQWLGELALSSDGSFSSNSTHQDIDLSICISQISGPVPFTVDLWIVGVVELLQQETHTLQLGNFFGLGNSTSHSLGSRCQDFLTEQNRTIRDVVWESKNLHFFERNESRSLHWNKEIAKSDTEKMSAVKSFSSSG